MKAEVAALGSLSLIVFKIYVEVKQHLKKKMMNCVCPGHCFDLSSSSSVHFA